MPPDSTTSRGNTAMRAPAPETVGTTARALAVLSVSSHLRHAQHEGDRPPYERCSGRARELFRIPQEPRRSLECSDMGASIRVEQAAQTRHVMEADSAERLQSTASAAGSNASW